MTDGQDDIFEAEYEVDEGAQLVVGNISGRIAVRAAEGSAITIRAVKHGSERARSNTRIEASLDGNTVSVRTRTNEGFGDIIIGRGLSSVDYDIVVPPGCGVRAKGVSADIQAEGTHAPISIETVSGDVVLSDALGDCSVSSVSGDVDARGVEGPLRLHTTSGDCTVVGSHLRSFNLQSVSGDLTIETPLTVGQQYYARTVSGDLTLLLPADGGATVQMKSVSGNVHSDLPAQIIRSGRRHWQGLINGGGPNVELHSVSGDLHISGSGEAAAVAAVAAETRAGNVSGVLQSLEQGEISVEEAMSKLRSYR